MPRGESIAERLAKQLEPDSTKDTSVHSPSKFNEPCMDFSMDVPEDAPSGPVHSPVRLDRLDMTSATELLRCPHCTRNFSKEAAERHIPICSQLRTRPKAPVKEPVERFTDTLGRRTRSRPGTAGSCKTPSGSRKTPASSPLNVCTPARSCHSSSKPPSQAPTPSSIAGRRLNLGDEGCEGHTVSSSGSVMSALSDQWTSVQFLLKNGCDALWKDAAITATASTAEDCLKFLDKLEDWAGRLKMRKGALSRMLLPFDLETNSNDQAVTAGQAPLGSQELDGRIPDEERRELVAQAIALRRLIRVKVADCNDVEQARDSLRLTAKFLRELKQQADEDHRTMVSILRDL